MKERHLPYLLGLVIATGALILWWTLSIEPATEHPFEPVVGVHIDEVRAQLGKPVRVMTYKSGERGETFQFVERWEVAVTASIFQPTSRSYHAVYDTTFAGVHDVTRRIEFILDDEGMVKYFYQEKWWDMPGIPVRKQRPKKD